MEFDLNNTVKNTSIQYNYENTTFYKNQFEKTLENGGYIKIPYPSKSNTPNITSNTLLKGEYVTKNLYIVKKIHNIKDTPFDGELVIEHKSLTNNEKTLYVCFLLKSSKSKTEPIDTLLKSDSDVTLNFNDYITDKTSIFYETNKEHVLVFPTPIQVNSTFDNYTSPILTSIPKDYSIVNIKSTLGNIEKVNIEGFKEGAVDYVDVATYCQPIDEEDPTIGVSADVIIPADGKVSINKATSSQLSTALNFFGFFIMVLFVVIVVPTMYQYFIVLLVLDNKYNETPFTGQQLLNRISAVDIVMGFLLFMFSFSLINNGIANNRPTSTVIGFYVFIFFISSFIVLQYRRTFNAEEYLKPFGLAPDLNRTINPDIFGFIMDNVVQLFIKYEKDPNDPTKSKPKFQWNWIIVIIIYLLLHFFVLRRYGMDKKGSASVFMYVPLYVFFLAMYIAIYIKHAKDVRARGQ
jgi:hypothetical protein